MYLISIKFREKTMYKRIIVVSSQKKKTPPNKSKNLARSKNQLRQLFRLRLYCVANEKSSTNSPFGKEVKHKLRVT
ncbi:unnamed protein product [Arabidopsis halleri]